MHAGRDWLWCVGTNTSDEVLVSDNMHRTTEINMTNIKNLISIKNIQGNTHNKHMTSKINNITNTKHDYNRHQRCGWYNLVKVSAQTLTGQHSLFD